MEPLTVLALDISTSSGYAVFKTGADEPELSAFGVVANEKGVHEYGDYPWCFYRSANDMAQSLDGLVQRFLPDVVVIEETNSSIARYSQKILEFCHCLFIREQATDPSSPKVVYVNSSGWRKQLNIRMSKEQKAQNAKLASAARAAKKKGVKLDKKTLGIRGKINKKHLALNYVNEKYGLKLKVKDDDIADAIALGLAYINGAEICNGK